MKARFETLPDLLSRGLAPVYYVSGDEPLQRGQACDLIRAAAVQQACTDRQVLHVERGFDWQSLLHLAGNLSLFSERKLIELKLGSNTPGKEGGAVLQHFLQSPATDNVLLMSGDKLDAAQQRSAWFTALEEHGVVIQIWPIETARLPQWLAQRLKQRGLIASAEAVHCLADHVEGNLLAADQEIEKLALLYGQGELSLSQVQQAVADSARFDIFALVDEALRGDAARTSRMIYGLRSEGTDPVLVLWALAREIRSMARMAEDIAAGQSIDAVMARERVWDKRKVAVRNALKRSKLIDWQGNLQRSAQVDRIVKGQGSGRVWEELLELALSVAGKPALRQPA